MNARLTLRKTLHSRNRVRKPLGHWRCLDVFWPSSLCDRSCSLSKHRRADEEEKYRIVHKSQDPDTEHARTLTNSLPALQDFSPLIHLGRATVLDLDVHLPDKGETMDLPVAILYRKAGLISTPIER